MNINSNDPKIIAALIAATVSVLAAIVSAAFSLSNYLFSKKIKKIEAEKDIGSIYDMLIDYRLKHPEVLALSRKWEPDFIEKIYSQKSADDKQWVIYYGYIELCIGYCNAVLYYNSTGLLEKAAYELHHEPLVKLLVTEHFPIIYGLAKEEKYVSPNINKYIESKKNEWDWEKEYQSITEPIPV